MRRDHDESNLCCDFNASVPSVPIPCQRFRWVAGTKPVRNQDFTNRIRAAQKLRPDRCAIGVSTRTPLLENLTRRGAVSFEAASETKQTIPFRLKARPPGQPGFSRRPSAPSAAPADLLDRHRPWSEPVIPWLFAKRPHQESTSCPLELQWARPSNRLTHQRRTCRDE